MPTKVLEHTIISIFTGPAVQLLLFERQQQEGNLWLNWTDHFANVSLASDIVLVGPWIFTRNTTFQNVQCSCYAVTVLVNGSRFSRRLQALIKTSVLLVTEVRFTLKVSVKAPFCWSINLQHLSLVFSVCIKPLLIFHLNANKFLPIGLALLPMNHQFNWRQS